MSPKAGIIDRRFNDSPRSSAVHNDDDRLVHVRRTSTATATAAANPCTSLAMPESKFQIEATLRSIKQRLANIEERNNDPFGDVKNALKSIDAFRQDLYEQLSQRYQHNIDQMSQAAKSLGTWHGQLKTDVNKYCDERNSKLHEGGEEIFSRLRALEQPGLLHTLEGHDQRLNVLEADAKTFVDKRRMEDFTAKFPRLDKAFDKHRHHEAQRYEQPNSRVGTLMKAVQENSSCAMEALDKANKECAGGYNELQVASNRFHARISRLEKDFETTQPSKGSESDILKLEKVVKSIDAYASDIKRLEAGIDAVRSTVNQLEADDSKHDEQSRARDYELNTTAKTVLNGLAQLQKRFDALEKMVRSGSKAQCSHCKNLSSQLVDLAKRVDDYEKTAQGRSKSLSDNIQSLSSVSDNLQAATQEAQIRMNNIESNAEAAGLSARIESLAQQIAGIKTSTQVGHSAREGDSLSEQVIVELERHILQVVKDQVRKECVAVTAGQAELRQRIENVEKHAQTNTEHHAANTFDHKALQKRLSRYEELVPKTLDGNVKMMLDRLCKIENQLLDGSIQQQLDTISTQSTEGLARLTDRVSALDNTATETAQRLESAQSRISNLNQSDVDVATKDDLDSLTVMIERVRTEATAAKSGEPIDSIAQTIATLSESLNEQEHTQQSGEHHRELRSWLQRLDDEIRTISVASGVRGQSIDDLVKRFDAMAARLDEKQEAMEKLSQNALSLADGRKNLKEDLLDLRDFVEDTRGWVGRVSEKSQRDDQSILGRLQLCERELELRTKFTKDGVERLQTELQELRSAELHNRRRCQISLADDVGRLRERLDGSEIDEEARQQLEALATLMIDRLLLTPSGEVPASQNDEHTRQNLDASNDQNAQRNDVDGTDDVRATVGGASPTAIDDSDLGSAHTHGRIRQAPCKRRRSNLDSENGQEGERQAPASDGDGDGNNVESLRRSDRCGKGKHRRLNGAV